MYDWCHKFSEGHEEVTNQKNAYVQLILENMQLFCDTASKTCVCVVSVKQLFMITYFQENIHTEDSKGVNAQLKAQCVAVFQKSALV